jgi:hypothetical protein
MTLFQEREDDVDIPPIHMTQQMNQEQDTSSNLNQGPLTRSCAKKLQQQMTSLLAEFGNNITENIILPKSSTLAIIRFKHQGYDGPQEPEGAYRLENIQRKHAVKLGSQRSDRHHRASSEWHKENTIYPDLWRVMRSISTQWKDNQVNFLMQQTACHLDSPVKSNDSFTSSGQELKGLRECISWWLFESSKPTN